MSTTTRRVGAPMLPPVLAYAVLTVFSVAVPSVFAGIGR